jgi:butyryl-CoA dehydrogenase
LYEGTTGIQSLDLLGRKVSMEKGKALRLLIARMQETTAHAAHHEHLQKYAASLNTEIKRVTDVLTHLSKFAGEGDVDRYLADATVFMEMMGYVVVGWQWLKQAVVAHEQVQKKSQTQTSTFYEGILHTMKFFFRYELPHAEACAKTMLDPEYLTQLKDKKILG